MKEPALTSSTFHHRYDTCKEASLVRLALNALQGVQSAIISIEKLHAAFCSDPADRTHLQNSSLWNRSSSTQALGKILKSIGCSGTLVYLLRKFVDSFLNLNCDRDSVNLSHRVSESARDQCQSDSNMQKEERPPYSLVNQAFAVAVGHILDGYVCALDTLSASVHLRRSSKSADLPHYAAYGSECLTNFVHSEVTLLELYLHTKDLRTRIETLGNICKLHDIALCFSVSPFEDLITTATLKFPKFYRGGDLLTYLYEHLQVADPGYCALLKYLFLCSYEPYCDFIRSWIFKAQLSDPYKEFVVEFVENQSSCVDFKAGIPIHFSVASTRDGVAIPCFLKDHLSPLLRAGQQLQVLKKLFELCNHVGPRDYTFEDFLPCWDCYTGKHLFCQSTLTFNKQDLEALVLARDSYYREMLQNLERLLLKLELRHQQVVSQNCSTFLLDKDGGSLKTLSTSPVDERWNFPSTVDKQSSNMADDKIGSDCSSPEGELCGLGSSDLSECSSLSGSEVPSDSEQLNDHSQFLIENFKRYLSSLGFCNGNPIDKTLDKHDYNGSAPDTDGDIHETDETADDLFLCSSNEEANVGYLFVPRDLEKSKWFCISNTLCKDDPPNDCSSRHFLKNGHYDDERSGYQKSLNGVNFVEEAVETNVGVLDEGIMHFSRMSIGKGALIAETLRKYECGNDNFTSELLTLRPWKLNHSKFLSANPMSKENKYFYLRSGHGRRYSSVYKQSLNCFDFSFVEDPCKATLEKLTLRPSSPMGYQTLSGIPASANGCEGHEKGKHGFERDNILKSNDGVSFLYPTDSKEHTHGTAVKNVYGGNHWECSLGNFSYNDDGNGRGQNIMSSTFEIPLDVIIEKCLLQEILLQYKYVSKLAIKILEEGFHLQEHLLALRRYYFMELADWADFFVVSLCNHKWCITEAHQRLPEIQGFLELSVQRSSCERDPYKDRLFVYIKGNGIMPIPTSAIGVRSFNFLGLGYRVDWPVNIVLTHSALRIYSEIFSFLIQMKLAAFSLTDVWSSLKDSTSLKCCQSGEHKPEVGHFKMFTKIWHQVNHFIATLSQYVQSQLSQLAWCGFLHSLNYKVNDMMDLESVHMAYLVDSLNICFLSDETRAIASIIENILQCALDFRSCINSNRWDVRVNPSDSLCEVSRINTSQVQIIKQKFDSNLKELYLYYLKSPKHGEFGLSRLWGLLNYNDYYTDIINRMDLYAFQV